MRHIKPYVDNSQSFGISHPVNYSDLIANEAAILDRIESIIPHTTRLELELNLLLNEGMDAVDNFHRELLKGKNILLNKVPGMFSRNKINEINESYESIVDELKSIRLNEDDTIPTDAKKAASGVGKEDWDNALINREANIVASGDSEDSASILGVCKRILSALTENGSPIGILHLVLDIIGLVGDGIMMATGVPVGLIADIINGLIYLVRGKWLLATISFIAAVIPFGGDIMKGAFKGSKVGAEVTQIAATYTKPSMKKITGPSRLGKSSRPATSTSIGGRTITSVGGKSTSISRDAIELAAKADPKSLTSLAKVAKSSKSALPIIGNIISKFFSGFLAKIVGWVPFIGGPLKRFFNGIADMFGTYKKVAIDFANDVPSIIKLGHAKKLDTFFQHAAVDGATITSKGNKLIVTDIRGVAVHKIPAAFLSPKFLKQRYGTSFSNEIIEYMATNKINVAAYYKQLTQATKRSMSAWDVVHKIGKVTWIMKGALPLFIGKQIIHFIDGWQYMNLTDGEIKNIGLASIQDVVKKARDKYIKENPGGAYHVPILNRVDESDESIRSVVNRTLHKQAKVMGLPGMVEAVYAKNRNSKALPPHVSDFYKKVLDGKVIDKLESELTHSESNESVTYKHITPFSKFTK
jgi:hypothetical protein